MVLCAFITLVIKENWAYLQLQKSMRSTCPTFVEFDIKI